MNKIIILGGGYIGTNVANYIASNFNEKVYVIGLNNDYIKSLNPKVSFISKHIEQITDDSKRLFDKAIVIDALGNTNATNNLKESSTLFIQNCASKFALLEKLSKFKIKKYIFLSSGGTVYSDTTTHHKEIENIEPNSIYSLEKVVLEYYLKIMNSEISSFNYLILRLSNPYGGIVSKSKKQGIIDVAIEKIKNNEVLDFYGDLDNVRDYIYIDNVAEYIYKISISNEKNDVFNIGSGIGYSLKEVLSIIEEACSKELKVKSKKIDVVNIKNNILDISKIEKYVKIENKISLKDGIAKVIKRDYDM